ncbi:MAG: hypothetical protein MUF33_02655 [Candidatus Nanopelagicales bacterium]|jgi:hypothetical protein|nr:hypothetical protein [Candidatus Nanopelagicales bacterium]
MIRQRIGTLSWKAVVAAAAIFLVTAGAAFASAMALSGGSLVTGSVAASCQSSTITPTWNFAYDQSIPGYEITAVTLDGLQAGCLDRSVKVVLADVNGVQVVAGSGTTPSSGTAATIALDTSFNLTSTWVRQLTVVVYG